MKKVGCDKAVMLSFLTTKPLYINYFVAIGGVVSLMGTEACRLWCIGSRAMSPFD